MGSKVNAQQLSMPPQPLEHVGPPMTAPPAARPHQSIPMMAVVKDALARHFGSLKAAAIELAIDQSQLSRDLESGDFKMRRLEASDHAHRRRWKRQIALGMYQTFGGDDPQSRRRRVIRSLRQGLDELAEIEGAA